MLRFTPPLGLIGLAVFLTFMLAGAADARMGFRPDQPARVSTMRVLAQHYREVTWTYERAANLERTPSSAAERRTSDPRALQRSVDVWTRRAYLAQRRALAALHRRLPVALPPAPSLHARVG